MRYVPSLNVTKGTTQIYPFSYGEKTPGRKTLRKTCIRHPLPKTLQGCPPKYPYPSDSASSSFFGTIAYFPFSNRTSHPCHNSHSTTPSSQPLAVFHRTLSPLCITQKLIKHRSKSSSLTYFPKMPQMTSFDLSYKSENSISSIFSKEMLLGTSTNSFKRGLK